MLQHLDGCLPSSFSLHSSTRWRCTFECESAAQKGLQCFVNGGNKIDEFSNTMVEIMDRIIFLTFVLVLCNFLLLWSLICCCNFIFTHLYILKKLKIKKKKKKKTHDSTILLMKYRSYCRIASEQGKKKNTSTEN
jgi:hypothetical protein